MKKVIVAAALILTTGVVSAFTIATPVKRDTTTTKPATKKDIGQADTKKDIGQADTKKDIGQAD
ncbi:hypothetical protein IDJ77_21700 [Mucilaginibacter sp. ZT4R22]|jgi:hypothetical protein|uniref:Pentapeptide MXKDX repeat protein n=1 Tax=Mucilaginibacter pankratovii TaxID=2772110 RepID=A0ABR7WVX6_9SPHI|nr:hypothetical protein [Mucilaginibacter pankratovii]MBD1366440.1 hypothetical protein [Mucilaginibacter pankratovii]MBD1366442.1 hypothetical protein [Mucilaginibacter pankratovii]MBD1366443.1 hypothetical protein [Mucilaginibacter pankratovii]